MNDSELLKAINYSEEQLFAPLLVTKVVFNANRIYEGLYEENICL